MSDYSSWVTGEKPIYPLLSASGQWMQGTSWQLEMGWFLPWGGFGFYSQICVPALGEQGTCHLSNQPLYMSHTGDGQSSQGRLRAAVLTCAASSLLSHPGFQDGHLRGSTLQGTRRWKAVPWLSVQGWNNAKSEKSCRERMQNHTYLACTAAPHRGQDVPTQGELHHYSMNVYTYILGPEFRVSWALVPLYCQK